jgi:anti-anti-sigma regulatory factor
MLMITEEKKNGEVILNLSGRLTIEHVSEVQKALESNGNGPTQFALDLTNVRFVDRAGMEFLRRVKSKRVNLLNIPSYVIRWIEQESQNDDSSRNV